jgi:4-hydroxythreonine-4-phosphate dehydrogenase
MSQFIPVVGITLGDPAGIGTEISLRAITDPAREKNFTPVLFGSPEVISRDLSKYQIDWKMRVVTIDDEISATEGEILVVATSGVEALIPYGQVTPAGGHAAVAAVKTAVEFCQQGKINAICTAPLNKESMREAGYHFDGHTEMLAEYTSTPSVSMLLIGRQLRVAHVTTHTSIRQVPDKITKERLKSVILIANEAMRNYGIKNPRIAVAGLNPHSGENGLFGDEENLVMRPVLAEMVALGLDVRGPASPDSVFIDSMSDKHDIVVVAYHDQGHIPVKLIERDFAVNVSGGLPIIRTSVDHGTAFDIAGLGIATYVNMNAAIAMASRLAIGVKQNAGTGIL